MDLKTNTITHIRYQKDKLTLIGKMQFLENATR
jgi:hypothetical protein